MVAFLPVGALIMRKTTGIYTTVINADLIRTAITVPYTIRRNTVSIFTVIADSTVGIHVAGTRFTYTVHTDKTVGACQVLTVIHMFAISG